MLNVLEHPKMSIDDLEQVLVNGELLIGRIRALQAKALAALDLAQVARVDGARSTRDWVAGRLDVSHDTARGLVDAAKLLAEHPQSWNRVVGGEVSFDRALATARLAAAGASEDQIADSAGYDIAGVARLATRGRRLASSSEQRSFRDRYLSIQPSLDDANWRLWGRLPAVDGAIVETALSQRADALPNSPEPEQRSARRVDALVAMAHDSLDPGGIDGAGGRSTSSAAVSIFVDAAASASTRGEAGAEVATGPRVGPATLEKMLCEGAIQIIAVDQMSPIAASRTTRAIPPSVRRTVLHRDGGCVIDGCASRHRLQPHHVIPFSVGGSHDAANLATLCWYHHHVAIHGSGYRLDPASPPRRRRLLPPARGPD